MPVASLNNAQVLTLGYLDGLTVRFSFERQSFAVQAHNGAIYYQLAYRVKGGPMGETWEFGEHHTVPALLTFSDPAGEGLPAGSLFAGIRFRRASLSGDIPRVTVQ